MLCNKQHNSSSFLLLYLDDMCILIDDADWWLMISLYLWWSLRHYELLEMNEAKTTCTTLLLPLLLTHIPVSVMWCACVSKSIWLCLLKRLVCCYAMMKCVGSLGRQMERKSSQASYLLFSQFCHPVRNSVITPVVCIYCYNCTNDSMQQTELKLWVAIELHVSMSLLYLEPEKIFDLEFELV